MIKRLLAAITLSFALQLAALTHSTVLAHTNSPHIASTAMNESADMMPKTTDSNCQYVVKSGDFLSRIAPTNWQSISVSSGNPNLIFVGEVLNLCPSPETPPNTTFGPVHFVTSNGTSCNSSYMFDDHPSLWRYPVGCYSGVYAGLWYNGSADCYAYVANITNGAIRYMGYHSNPIVGAVIWFAPGVLGASSVGHYGYVVGIQNGWMLVANQNYYWNGGGYGRVNFRYVPINTWGLSYRY